MLPPELSFPNTETNPTTPRTFPALGKSLSGNHYKTLGNIWKTTDLVYITNAVVHTYFKHIYQNKNFRWALVAHACNPSYSGGRDQGDHGSKPVRSNTL
jgi:hypothetical protein